MTLRSFLLAVEAVREEEGVRFHVETQTAPVPSPADARQRNAQSMAQLQGILGGMPGGTMKPRTR